MKENTLNNEYHLTDEEIAYCLKQIGLNLNLHVGHIGSRELYNLTGVSDKTFTGMKKGELDFHISKLIRVCAAVPVYPVSALNIALHKIEQFNMPSTTRCIFKDKRHCLVLIQNPMFNQPVQ